MSTSEEMLEALLAEAQSKEERLDLVLPRLEQMAEEEGAKLKRSLALLERLAKAQLGSGHEEEGEDSQDDDDERDSLSALESQLAQLEREKTALQQTVRQQRERKDAAAARRNQLWVEADECVSRQSAVHVHTTANEHKLDLLTSRTALSELFHISTGGGGGGDSGVYGTINGLKLGWIPNADRELVDVMVIEEVNAAWGFAALMLDSLARSMQFDFFVWRLAPKGSVSEMVNVKTPSQRLCLYLTPSSTNLLSSWWLWNTSFNAGVKAFASCVDEFADFLKLSDQSVVLPHRIDKSTIAGLPLHFSFNTGERWTRAMKYLLTDLKWLEIFCIRTLRARAGQQRG